VRSAIDDNSEFTALVEAEGAVFNVCCRVELNLTLSQPELPQKMTKPRTVKLCLNPLKPLPSGETDFKKLAAMTDEEIRAQSAGDPNFPCVNWSEADIEIVEPIVKTAVSIRLDSDVLEFFKDAGKGYQTRINQILRSYMEHQQKKTG
jgi:uncharacterized protein (DUF4415 family)